MKKIWVWSITAALAGFLFGFDTVVISGADKKFQDFGIPPMFSMGSLLSAWHFGVPLSGQF